MVSRNMVMKWFNKRRGLANAVLGIFTALGFSIAPKVLNRFIEHFEWRGTWALLAVIVGIAFAIFVIVIYRDNPEDCGCEPDGEMRPLKKDKRPPSLPESDFTLSEAKKTVAFWAFTLALAISGLYISGLTFHVVSVFESSGLTKEMGLGIFIPSSVIAVVVQFVCGYASDYIRLKYLLVLFVIGIVVSTIGLILLGGQSMAYWFIIIGNGIVWGLYTVLIGVTWPRFYGLKHLGAISGFSLSWTVIGSALGPVSFLACHLNFLGNYEIVSWFCAGIGLLLLIMAFKADNPGEILV